MSSFSASLQFRMTRNQVISIPLYTTYTLRGLNSSCLSVAFSQTSISLVRFTFFLQQKTFFNHFHWSQSNAHIFRSVPLGCLLERWRFRFPSENTFHVHTLTSHSGAVCWLPAIHIQPPVETTSVGLSIFSLNICNVILVVLRCACVCVCVRCESILV